MRVSSLFRALIVVAIVVMTANVNMLWGAGASPDFAFPEKVEKSAKSKLKVALKNNDGQGVVKSLIEMSLAQTMINTDSLGAVIRQIETVEEQEQNVAVKSLLNLLLAEIYTQAYQADSYKYSSREANATAGDDFRQWNKRQFARKVGDLAAKALAAPDELQQIKIAEYKDVITLDEGDRIFYPTMLDFVGSVATVQLQKFVGGRERMLNVGLLDNPTDSTLYPGEFSFPVGKILEIYKLLIERNEQNSAPLFTHYVATENFIGQHIFDADSDEIPFELYRAVDQPRSNKLSARMLTLYKENAENEFSALFLDNINGIDASTPFARECYEALRGYEERFPSSRFIPNVRNKINQLTAVQIYGRSGGVISPETPLTMTLENYNAKHVKVEVFDVTSAAGRDLESNYLRTIPKGLKPVMVKELDFDDERPFVQNREVEISVPKYGLYAVRLTADGKEDSGGFNLLRATDLSVAVSRDASSATAWIVDPLTGAPVADASVLYNPWSRRQAASPLPSVSDNEGAILLKVKEGGSLTPQKGEDKFALSTSFGLESKLDRRDHLQVDIFTSLGLYRPGDKVEFAGVAYRNLDLERNIADNKLISIELRDANFSPLDTLTVLTDSWGRLSGSFELPREVLTGYFSLRAFAKESGEEYGRKSFMVSDYKLPDFEVKTIAVTPPSGLSDAAVVKGNATTYSGFPVENAQVTLKLKVLSGIWWNRTESQVFYTAETNTDGSGDFTFIIPADVIAASPAPGGVFICDMTVTAENGESHDLVARFNMGKPYEINLNIPSEINAELPFSASVEMRDAMNGVVSSRLKYVIAKGKEEVSRGEVETGSISGILNTLPTASYTIQFAPVDSLLANPSTPARFVVYQPQTPDYPMELPVWLPRQNVRANPDGTASVIIGAKEDDTKVLVLTGKYPGETVERRWMNLRKGMQTLTLNVTPEGARVELRAIKDYQPVQESFEVEAAVEAPAVTTVETFRDKVTPGDKEMIKITVEPKNGATAASAVMLDMSSKSIDVLASNPLEMSRFRKVYFPFSMSGFNLNQLYTDVSKDFKYLTEYNADKPQFNLYGRGFMQQIYLRGTKYMKTASRSVATSSPQAYFEDAMEAADMAADEAMPMMAMAAGSADNGVVVEEGSVESEEVAKESIPVQEENYRPSEVPLAFFEPLLTTKEDGSLEFSYEVPNANTTWILRGLAYNRELLSASFRHDILASKPMMVSLNAPRFLRNGDNVELAATVMNNTDSTLVVTVVSEALTTSSGFMIAQENQEITLNGRGSALVTLVMGDVESVPGIIFRVKATADSSGSVKYTDGEMALIPVLPSQHDVVDSQMFYIPADQAQFTLPLPAISESDYAYLNFTENPAWQVVSALPGLRDSQINSSIDAASALFSAAVAEGILKENPEIGRVIRKWVESGDSALVSNLEKNQQLKSVLLNSTPWVSAALSDTERMQRLVLLFDGKETARVKRDAIAVLAKCYVDGGWCWTQQYPSVSPWATMVILNQLGQLNKMGYLPADSRLRSMIKGAVDYIDRREVKEFANYPKVNRWQYVMIRDLFPEYKLSTAASRVVEAQVQRSLADWKNADVALKGVYALILDNHGYHATARQLLASLREFATESPEKGMWWQQLDRSTALWSFNRVGVTALLLDAFNQIEPHCGEIEKIRQWLILNKTNNDWGNNVMTTQTVASVLRSGKPLKVNQRGTAIHVGSVLLEPTSAEYATGAFTEDISPLLSEPQVLTIDRQADYPSAGAVLMMRYLPMDSIKTVSCKEISIRKNLMIFEGEEWQPAEQIKVGDKVRVELLLNVEDDLSYVVIEDLRASGFEPVEQLPRPLYSEGICFYRENRDSQTNFFIDFLPRGVYSLVYDLYASQCGLCFSGAAEVQSQYNPVVAAHSAGTTIIIDR